MWRQKSRVLRLKEGDRNTKFFHKLANSHKRNNTIHRLKIGGNWLVGDNLKNGVVNIVIKGAPRA